MLRNTLSLFTALALLIAASPLAADTTRDSLQQQVADTERGFADTMARRDHAGFTAFLSSEAVFIAGNTTLRGKQQVADAWKPYFEEADAPFSWEPQTVEVLASGTLAISSGPVRNEVGETVGIYNSVWRQESSGEWKIVFDKGGCPCNRPAEED